VNTQTHLLLACAVLVPSASQSRMAVSKPVTITIIIAALLGALLPDASLFVMWGVAKSQGVADSVIWSDWYYSQFWQWIGAISNSLPLYATIAVTGLFVGGRFPASYRNSTPQASHAITEIHVNRASKVDAVETGKLGSKGSAWLRIIGLMLLVFALAAILHVLTDLPLHHDDGHPHFWPLTNWIFRSPVSYWDPAHHGNVWSAFEFLLALTLIVILWRRFDVRVTRFILFFVAVSYFVVSFYWWQLF